MAQCATTALAGAVPRPCVHGARGRFGGLGPVPGVVSLSFPPSRPACPALRVAGRPVRVSLTLAPWYAIPRGLCVPRARSSCPSGSPRVSLSCVCARAPAASVPPPLRSGAPPPPTARPLGGPLGSATHVLWARVCGCGGPTLSPWPACPVGAACRGGGGGATPGGVACHHCEGRLVSGAVPPPAARPLGRAARVPRPVCPGCGQCGCGDPAPAPRRALLRAGVARRGGGGMASPGGVLSAVVRGVWAQALPLPQLPALWAGCRGPLPTGCGCGGVRAPGPVTDPTARALASWLCALWGRHEGARGGRLLPGSRASGDLALSHPRLPALWAGCRGPLPTGCGCGVVRAWGPVTNPTARALVCCGGGMRVPGGGASCLGVGRMGSGALPPPTARPLGGLPGPTTHWLWVRGGAGVGNRHQPHSARSCELALRAVEAARGRPGGARLAWVWGVRGRALSHPRLPALWAGCRGPLPTGCGCGGVRAWGPVTNPTARALASWLCALWGQHEGARGGRLLPGCGASGVGALPPPTARPLGGLPGPTTHWLWVRGGAGVGTRHQPDSGHSSELALRAVGAARGRPGGAPPAWVWGVRGRALSQPRLPALWAGCRGPLPTGCGCGGVRAWGPDPHSAPRHRPG